MNEHRMANPWNFESPVKVNLLEAGPLVAWRLRMSRLSPFAYFTTSPEIIRLAVMLDIHLLGNV